MRTISLFLLLVILSLFIFSGQALAREEIFAISDPVGDDHGPGTYNYPRHSDFAPYHGLLDITQFSIERTEEYYYLVFSFEKLTNPWNKEYGFSHPLLELYIDNKEDGSGRSFQNAARVDFAEGFAWNKLLKISGEFVRLYYPEDEKEKQQLIDITGDIIYPDWEVTDYNIRTRENDIILQIAREEIGPLTGAKISILVGSFNPFGPGYFRELRAESAGWFIYDSSIGQEELNFAPRVMDVILPEEKEQQKVLAGFSRGVFAEVYPIEVDPGYEEGSYVQNLVSLIRLVVLPVLLLFIIITGFIFWKRPGQKKGQGS